jgi:hypothetical protein
MTMNRTSRLTSLSRVWLRVTALALIAGSGLSAEQQPLTLVAKQEEARRKAVSQPSRILTNADLKPDPLSVPPSSLPTSENPSEAVQPQQAGPLEGVEDPRRSDFCRNCGQDANERQPGDPVRRKSRGRAEFPNGRPEWTVDHVVPPWQLQVPIIGIPIASPSCGVNTPREQAMSNYMSAAGFGPAGPGQPCVPPAPH